MKGTLVLCFGALFLWLVFGAVRANRQIAEDKRVIADLVEKQKALDETPSLELQTRCGAAARDFFNRFNFSSDKGADYSNHYNARLKKCFVAIKTGAMQKSGTFLTSTDVYDAVEGKEYGRYIWQSDKVKAFFEVPPILCEGTPLDGVPATCKSEADFSNLMEGYMDVDD